MTGRHLRTLFVSLLLLQACRPEKEHPLFQQLTPDRTGVTFANTITTDDSLNVQTDAYVYNGAGVAIGDINNDGYLDIYVSVSGPPWSTAASRANLLFINNGDGTFTESAAQYGIADTGFTTQAVFLDYNGDGYLDLFLLENSPEDFTRGGLTVHPAGLHMNSPRSYNQLYRNNGDGTFTNVSKEAGILTELGYGLGVAVADFNGDGWPDIYISNDDRPNDVLYINNRDGTFTDRAAEWLRHTSYAGMGIDVADFNNDGWPDILQVDMMPEALRARKRMSGSTSYGDV